DVYYVEALIGPDTVDTMPPATLDAFRDHGRVWPTLEADLDEARAVIDALPRYGVDLSEVTARLVDQGVESFREAFDKLLAAIEDKRKSAAPLVERTGRSLPASLDAQVEATLADWDEHDKVRRLWARDASLWTGHDEGQWLAWLTIADHERGD